MAEHRMKVTFTNTYGKVKVEPNPLPGMGAATRIAPGDTIIWETGDQELQVVFLKYRKPNGPLEPCDPRGPFIAVGSSPGKIVGIVRDDLPEQVRFLYNLFYKGEALIWYNPVDKDKEAILAGGIDIPMTPMEQPTTG